MQLRLKSNATEFADRRVEAKTDRREVAILSGEEERYFRAKTCLSHPACPNQNTSNQVEERD